MATRQDTYLPRRKLHLFRVFRRQRIAQKKSPPAEVILFYHEIVGLSRVFRDFSIKNFCADTAEDPYPHMRHEIIFPYRSTLSNRLSATFSVMKNITAKTPIPMKSAASFGMRFPVGVSSTSLANGITCTSVSAAQR